MMRWQRQTFIDRYATRRLLVSLLVVPLLTCTRYDFLTREVYEQAKYSNKVDILFIVDNSGSMLEEQNALSENFATFIDSITAASSQEQSFPHVTLRDAVDNYLFYINNQNRFINFHLGVTTTEMALDDESPSFENNGKDGTLVAPFPDDPDALPYLTSEDPDVVEGFTNAVSTVQADAAAGDEKSFAAMTRAACLSLSEPERYDEDERLDLNVGCHSTVGLTALNEGFLRPEVALAVIAVTDEGEFSEGQVEDYLDFLDAIDKRASFSAIAPILQQSEDDPTVSCNPSSSPASSIERYRDITEETRGLHLSICEDFADALADLSRLINNLLARFKLKYVPDPDSIIVIVNGIEIDEDESNGWGYNPNTNEIEFTGTAVPSYSASIQFYYRTVTASDPRPLPF